VDPNPKPAWTKVTVGKTTRDVFQGEPQTGVIEPHRVGEWLKENLERAEVHLNRYFGDSHPDEYTYAGRHFEWFVARGSNAPGFSPDHFFAVNALSVNVPPSVIKNLFLKNSESWQLHECCAILHANSDIGLWNISEQHLAKFAELYDILRGEDGMGYVTTSKLLAARFPNIVPIRDSLVEVVLGLKNSVTWWDHIQRIVADRTTRDVLSEFPIENSDAEVGVLRRLDVILWMEARARNQDLLAASEANE